MKRIITILVVLAILLPFANSTCLAQQFARNWESKVFIGYNLGGTTPLPLPAEIRKVNSWSPGFSGTVAFHISHWLTPKWGLTTGLAIDLKGMAISADVKYMNTSLVVGEGAQTGTFSGTFSGKNNTTVRNAYLVLPVLAAYRLSPTWTFRLGGYIATQQNAKFEGDASDGYIRNGGPAGDRINIDRATFDFSEHIRKVDAGLMASADWFFTDKMALTGQLSWGLVPIFPSDFNGIPYKMYNVYLMLGLAYKL
ncbi:MAG: porin family protein [Tannerellaceae bacterium]